MKNWKKPLSVVQDMPNVEHWPFTHVPFTHSSSPTHCAPVGFSAVHTPSPQKRPPAQNSWSVAQGSPSPGSATQVVFSGSQKKPSAQPWSMEHAPEFGAGPHVSVAAAQ